VLDAQVTARKFPISLGSHKQHTFQSYSLLPYFEQDHILHKSLVPFI
jgi:hypothetical protein